MLEAMGHARRHEPCQNCTAHSSVLGTVLGAGLGTVLDMALGAALLSTLLDSHLFEKWYPSFPPRPEPTQPQCPAKMQADTTGTPLSTALTPLRQSHRNLHHSLALAHPPPRVCRTRVWRTVHHACAAERATACARCGAVVPART